MTNRTDAPIPPYSSYRLAIEAGDQDDRIRVCLIKGRVVVSVRRDDQGQIFMYTPDNCIWLYVRDGRIYVKTPADSAMVLIQGPNHPEH
jgi:hypothetical protein